LPRKLTSIAVAVAAGSLIANKNFAKIFRKEKGPSTFSWFQSCCGWRLRLTANRKVAVAVAVAVAVGNLDRNSGYDFWTYFGCAGFRV